MSRAFVKESDGSEPIQLEERQISPDRNFVTESGLALIDDKIEQLKQQLALDNVKIDEMEIAQLSRDLRYWQARRTSAEAIIPQQDDRVAFGHYIMLEDKDNKITYRIVGQDEADPNQGLLSYTAPLSKLLIGKSVGEEVSIGDRIWEIIAIKITTYYDK